MRKARLGGFSSATGFQIFDITNRITVKTRDYWETDWEKLYKIWYKMRLNVIWLVPRVLLKLLLIVLSKIHDWEYRRYYQSSLEKCVNEWHSCEHKLIWLIENNKDITLETLKLAPDYDPKCGLGSEQISHLKEPSLEKLEETLLVGQEYYQKLSQLRSKKLGV